MSTNEAGEPNGRDPINTQGETDGGDNAPGSEGTETGLGVDVSYICFLYMWLLAFPLPLALLWCSLEGGEWHFWGAVLPVSGLPAAMPTKTLNDHELTRRDNTMCLLCFRIFYSLEVL